MPVLSYCCDCRMVVKLETAGKDLGYLGGKLKSMLEEMANDSSKKQLKKKQTQGGNVFKKRKEISWRKRKAAMKQFRENMLLEQLIQKPEVNTASTTDTNNDVVNETRSHVISRKSPMLSIALPGSILNNAQSPELRTYLAGQIARSAAVFCVDEIIIYDETARMKPQQRENYCSGQWYPDLPVHSGNIECNFHLARILEFMECPQYLRKILFPLQKTLKYAGILNPLDCPHHLRISDLSVPYREGIVLDKPVKSGHGPVCNIGLYKNVQINEEVALESGTRVTVKILDIHSEKKRYHGCLVNSQQIKREAGLYWGYKVRIALSLHDALNAEKYDVIIGTSERGKPVSRFGTPLSERNRVLIVFGGLEGLEAAVKADKNITCSTPEELFEHYLNVVPGQGSRIIRTEEAIPITLATLRSLIYIDL
ncbi:putative methyltransferase C9orf114 [Dirofilaria immitis]